MSEFGDTVRWLRTRVGLSQGELAKRIRVNRHHPTASYVSRIESGILDPRLSTIRSIARELKVKPWQLLAGIAESTDFWRGYLDLTPTQKREIQHHIKYLLRRER